MKFIECTSYPLGILTGILWTVLAILIFSVTQVTFQNGYKAGKEEAYKELKIAPEASDLPEKRLLPTYDQNNNFVGWFDIKLGKVLKPEPKYEKCDENNGMLDCFVHTIK